MKTNLLQLCSEEKFSLASLSRYFESVSSKMQDVLEIEKECFDLIPDDPTDDSTVPYEEYYDSHNVLQRKVVDQWVTDRIEQFLVTKDFSYDLALSIPQGYVCLGEYLESYLSYIVNTTMYDNPNVIKLIPVYNNLGAIVSYTDSTRVEVNFKSTLHSVYSMLAANKAMLFDNISDRINVFNDYLHQIYSNVYDDVSNVGGYLRNIISNTSVGIREYLTNINQLTGLSQLADPEDTFVPENALIYQYTGANPVCALNFAGVTNVALQVLNTGFQVVYGVISTIFRGIGYLLGKAGKYIIETTVNPYDLKIADDKSHTYTVNGLSYQFSGWAPYSAFGSHINTILHGSTWDNDIGRVFKMSNLFAEVHYKIDGFSDSGVNYTVEYKPRCINPMKVYGICALTWPVGVNTDRGYLRFDMYMSQNNFHTFYELLSSESDIYLSTDADESLVCLGFALSCQLLHMLLYFSTLDINGHDPSVAPMTPIARMVVAYPTDYINAFLSNGVTNKDFARTLSGWDGLSAFDPLSLYIPGTNVYEDRFCNNSLIDPLGVSGVESTMSYGLIALLYSKRDQVLNPTNYLYIPYVSDESSYDSCTFSLKSDDTNREAFVRFAAIALIAIVTSVVAFKIITKIKRWKRDKYIKYQREKGIMDNDMWNKKFLTDKQKKQYIRCERKIAGLSSITAGMQEAGSVISTVQSVMLPKDDTSMSLNYEILNSITEI